MRKISSLIALSVITSSFLFGAETNPVPSDNPAPPVVATNSKADSAGVPLPDIDKRTPSSTESSSTTTKELSDSEIDEIFISFSKEREENKRRLEEKKNSYGSQGSYNVSGGNASPQQKERKGNPVFPRNPSSPMTVGVNGDVMSGSPQEIQPEEMMRMQMQMRAPQANSGDGGAKIDGISCDKGRCVAFIGGKTYKVGDIAPSGNKIKMITSKGMRVETHVMAQDGTIKKDTKVISF